MNSEIQEAIILMLDRNMSVTKFNYDSSLCLYMGQETEFSTLFLK